MCEGLHSPEDHGVVSAVRLSTWIGRRNGKRPGELTQMARDRVVGDSDHDAVPGSHAVVRRPDTYAGPTTSIVNVNTRLSSPPPPPFTISSPRVPSLRSQSPLLTMQLMPPGYTFLMNSHRRGLKGGLAAISCSTLEMQMQTGFSAGLS